MRKRIFFLSLNQLFGFFLSSTMALTIVHSAFAIEPILLSHPHTKLRVGIMDLAPYSYFINNKPVGIGYDFWQLVAQYNQFDCEYIPISGAFDNAVSEIARGEIDVALSIGFASDREKIGYFSLPYFRSHFVLLAKKMPVNISMRLYQLMKNINPNHIIFIIIAYWFFIVIFVIFERSKQPELLRLNNWKAFELTVWRSLLSGNIIFPFFPETRIIRTVSLILSFIIKVFLLSLFAGLTSSFIYIWSSSGEQLTSLSDLDNKMIDAGLAQLSSNEAERIGLTVDRVQTDIDDAVKRLDQNKVPAIFIPDVVAVAYLKTHNRPDLYISKIRLPSLNIGFLFNDKYAYLLQDVDYSILKINETGEKTLICKKYLGNLGAELCY
jgi:ABC-type amino acid transport substrate-binding protein